MIQKLLTVSVAAYNVETYLKETLDSCIVPLKVRKYLEVVVVNDGSNDNTGKIARSYSDRYPDLFVCIDKENGGYGSTINRALKIAQGKYFRLLDGDDYFNKNELCNFIKGLGNIDTDLILNDYTICYEKRHHIEIRKLNLENKVNKCISELNLKNGMGMSSFCYKTDILKKYKISIDEKCLYTDIEFLVRPLRYVKSFMYLENNLYQYRIGREGQSVSVEGMKHHYKDAQKVLYAVLDELCMRYEYSNIQKAVERVAGTMLKRVLKCMMCIEVSNKNRKKILEFDKSIKREFPEVYAFTDKSLLFYLLHRTQYWIYPIWRIIGK